MIDLSSKNAWKRPFKNAKKLLFGRSIQAVLSVAYLAMATRALGVENFGVFTLIISTVGLVGTLASFQPAQFILRYGARAITNKNPAHLKKIIRFGIKLELLAALVAVLAVWLLTEPLVALFSIAPQYAHMMELYALILPLTLLSGLAMGSLQLTDRHDLISWQLTADPTIKFIGAGLLFIYGGGVAEFLAVWAFSRAIGAVVMGIMAWRNMKTPLRTLRQEVAAGAETAPITKGRYGAPEAGAWNFLWGTYFNGSLGVDLVPMLVATVLGPEGAGLIRIAQRIAAFIIQPIQKLLAPAVMTDMTWLNAQGNNKNRRKMVIKAGAIAGGVTMAGALVLIIFGKQVIGLIAGEEFVPAYGAMVFITLAMTLGAFYFTVPPLLITGGKVWSVAICQFGQLILFALYLPLIVTYVGVTGAGIAFLFHHMIGATFLTFLAWPLLRKKHL